MTTPTTLGLAAVVLASGYWILWCIYSLFLHPLAKYPGPRLAAVSNLHYARTWTGGKWPHVMEQLHRQYGDVVRIAPDEISFASIQSFKDIYGPPSKTRKLFPKSELFYDDGNPNIAYERDPDKHAVVHQLFAPPFRTQALRYQEPVIHEHTDCFIEKLVELSRESEGFNVAHAFEWLTFDIMGELTFGEPFGAVKEAKTNYWVSILLEAIYGGSVGGLKNRIPALRLILPWLVPKAAVAKYAQHYALTLEKVRGRIKMEDGDIHREDFFASIIRSGKMNEQQLAAQAGIFLTAGAETSATVLTATTYYLATHPEAHEKLRAEVTEAFSSYDKITGDATAALPYLHAVLEETMRIFPPSPVGPPRVSPGEFVDGIYVPQGVYVSTDIMSLHHDPRNAPQPHEWKPERWTGTSSEKPYSVPFSIGPRACIGRNLAYLEMKIALAKIVYRLDWEIVGESFDWPSSCKLTQLWKKEKLMVRYWLH